MNTVACLICRLFDRCDPCSSEPRWLAVGSYQLSASSRDRLCQFVARHCRSVAWAEQATGRRKTAGRILSSEPSVPPCVIHLTALCPGLPGWGSTRKVKPIWILLKQETVSGSGISRAVCKSAPRTTQITTPAPHHSVFYRPDALPAAQTTVSKHWRPLCKLTYSVSNTFFTVSEAA